MRPLRGRTLGDGNGRSACRTCLLASNTLRYLRIRGGNCLALSERFELPHTVPEACARLAGSADASCGYEVMLDTPAHGVFRSKSVGRGGTKHRNTRHTRRVDGCPTRQYVPGVAACSPGDGLAVHSFTFRLFGCSVPKASISAVTSDTPLSSDAADDAHAGIGDDMGVWTTRPEPSLYVARSALMAELSHGARSADRAGARVERSVHRTLTAQGPTLVDRHRLPFPVPPSSPAPISTSPTMATSSLGFASRVQLGTIGDDRQFPTWSE